MTKDGPLTDYDKRQLLRIARLIDGEAQTWIEGFAAWTGKEWRWTGNPDSEFAHVRYVKLQNASTFLRDCARSLRPTPQEAEANAVAA